MKEKRWTDWTPFTYPFNLTQQPAASIPCGLTKAGLPVGLQIVGPRYDDCARAARGARVRDRRSRSRCPTSRRWREAPVTDGRRDRSRWARAAGGFRRRRTGRTATSSRPAAISSRRRWSPPTGRASSRCRSKRREPLLGWWSPDPRGILPLDGLRVTRSMRQSAKRFEVRVDTCFGTVIRACGDPSRESGWITRGFISAYTALHELGWAHSVEVFDREGDSGRRPLRRAYQRAVRRRVDVPPAARRVEGGADGARGPDAASPA